MTSDGVEPASNLTLLLIGGDPASYGWIPSVPETPTLVVAADSGLDGAVAAGLQVHHVVGDLDSVDLETLARAEAAGTIVHRHPADKDATDIELALDLVLSLIGNPDPGVERRALLVVGPGGGRLDHLFGDVLVLASARLAGLDITARIGRATLTVVHPGRPRKLSGRPHDQVSLLPVHGTARGVSTTGLRWPLVDADLVAGTTRGVSNELVDDGASVGVAEGTVVVLQPGTVAADVSTRETPYNPSPRAPSPPDPSPPDPSPRRTEP